MSNEKEILEKQVEILLDFIQSIEIKASSGMCSFTVRSKHSVLTDINKRCNSILKASGRDPL